VFSEWAHKLIKQLTNSGTNPQYKEKFIVNYRNQWHLIKTDDIASFCKEAVNHIYLNAGERYTLDYNTLDEIETLLDSEKFNCANRQFIIKLEAIQTIKPTENSNLIIKLKEPNHKLEIDVSRLKTPEFKKWLEK